MQKWIFHDFSVKTSKFFDSKLISEIKRKLKIFNNTLKYHIDTSLLEMRFVYVIYTNLFDIDLSKIGD